MAIGLRIATRFFSRLPLIGALTLIAALTPLADALSQSSGSDPVMAAYRDYKTAAARGDFFAAERAAASALDASEARDGEGGKTAVLALNLAVVRLRIDQPKLALAPAMRALSLAQKEGSGIKPLTAKLVAGRAQLSTDYTAAKRLLVDALQDAQIGDADVQELAYDASVALANAGVSEHDWIIARTGWDGALAHISGAPGDKNFERGKALTGRGVSFIPLSDWENAIETLTEAVAVLAPYAPETETGAITRGDFEFSQAASWLYEAMFRKPTTGTVRAGRVYISDLDIGQPHLAGQPALCPGDLLITPRPWFPELLKAMHGIVIVRVKIDENGDVLSHEVLASTPYEDFSLELDKKRVTRRWRFERAEDAPPGCRMASAGRDFLMKYEQF
jgi:hypothetical protein